MRSTGDRPGVTGIVALHKGGAAIWTGGWHGSCVDCVLQRHCSSPDTRRIAFRLCSMRCWTAGIFHRASAGEILEILDRMEARGRA